MKPLLLALAALSLAAGLSPQKDPGDAQAKTFLDEANKILREDPSDGKFGMSRLPTLHGRQYFDNRKEKELKITEAWNSLAKENFMAVGSYGQFKDGTLQRYSLMSGHYQLNWEPLVKADTNAFLEAESKYHEFARAEAAKLYQAKKERAKTIVFDYVDRKAKLDLRAVFPSSKECLTCHRDVKAGEPIGIIGIVRVPRKSLN